MEINRNFLGAMLLHVGAPTLFRRDRRPEVNDISKAAELIETALRDWELPSSTWRTLASLFLTNLPPHKILHAMHSIVGDLAITCPSAYFAEKFASHSNHSSYYYYFTHLPSSEGSSGRRRDDWLGATHQDEVKFVFGHPIRFPQQYSEKDVAFSKAIMRIWITFAKTG